MASLKVITDSSCDLRDSDREHYDIGIVPVSIRFGAEEFLEGVTLNAETFYARFADQRTLPQTSQPSVGQFATVYRHWARHGYDTILSIHVASTLSGTLSAATQAAREVANEVTVIPYDSQSGSAAMGWMCVEAAQMARAGTPLPYILARLNEVRSQVRIVLTLATLRYAEMSGRISNLQRAVASILHIQPIVTLCEGRLSVMGLARSRRASLERICELTRAAAGQTAVKLAVIHGRARAEAEQLLEQARDSLNVADAFVGDIALSLAAHFGPGVIGTVLYPVRQTAEG
jgi:DegV family protein with EDD domain